MRRPHSQLLPVCAILLLVSGCVSRMARNPGPQSLAVERGVKPASLSDYIRGIYKLSGEATKMAEQRAALLKDSPDLQILVDQVETNPSDAHARRSLVAEYMSRELYWGAYTLLTDPLPLNIEDPETNLNLAIIWDAWAQYDLALQHGERAFANGAVSQRTLETLGRIHLHRNQPADAIEWYGRALEKERTATILANLGYAHILKGELETARARLEEALLLDKSLEQAQNNLAIVLSRTGDESGALKHLLEASRPAVAYNNMGVLHLQQKNTLEAQHYFQEALRLEPGYELAQKNLSALEATLPPPAILRLPPSVIEPASPKEMVDARVDRLLLGPARPVMMQSSHLRELGATVQPAAKTEDAADEVNAVEGKKRASNIMPITDNPQRPVVSVPALNERQRVVQEYGNEGLGMAGVAGLIFMTGLFALRSRNDRSAARRDSNQ